MVEDSIFFLKRVLFKGHLDASLEGEVEYTYL